MNHTGFDYTKADAMAMPVTPMDSAAFNLARYEAFAAEADQRYAGFLRKKEGVAVWQRVRVGEVFRDQCRDMKQSLRWQLSGLTRAMDYLTDAPAYLEPWYGIGTAASAFGAEYEWLPGQSPAVKPVYRTMDEIPELAPREVADVPILRYTLETIEYFLEQTHGRVPMSWCDIQSPINVAGGLVNITQFLMALHDDPDRAKAILSVLADEVIRFTKIQSRLIGAALARPGHGFASSRAGTGIGLSTDNLIMVSPAMYVEFCADHSARIGDDFGGTAIHSCGNWGRWLPAVKKIRNLILVDGAFSPQTDPAHNNCEEFRDSLANTGVILHVRIVGEPEEVLSRVKRLWQPGLKLIVGTHVQDPKAQHQLYHDIHRLCAEI
jgi:uroporphyrinogen-III decarboxylase